MGKKTNSIFLFSLLVFLGLCSCNKKEIIVPELIGTWRLDSLSYEGKILKNMDVEKDKIFSGQFINLQIRNNNEIFCNSYLPEFQGRYLTYNGNKISFQVFTSSDFVLNPESNWSPYFVTCMNIVAVYKLENNYLTLSSSKSKLFFTKK